MKREEDRTLFCRMYKSEIYEDGTFRCGRCLEKKQNPERHKLNKGLCRPCYLASMSYRTKGLPHNKWNIKDEFCHIRIREGSQHIYIGIKADDRLQKWLTAMGYGFIFKEEYER